MKPILVEFLKKYRAMRKEKAKAALRDEYLRNMSVYFQKLRDEKKLDEAWALLKKISASEADFQCIKIRHLKSVTAGIPELGVNALWSSMMLFTVDFALLKVFSDLAFGNPVSRPAALLAANVI